MGKNPHGIKSLLERALNYFTIKVLTAVLIAVLTAILLQCFGLRITFKFPQQKSILNH